ncbi:MAG: hypothetical protein QW328_07770 [Nitrososphaerota archaeon]
MDRREKVIQNLHKVISGLSEEFFNYPLRIVPGNLGYLYFSPPAGLMWEEFENFRSFISGFLRNVDIEKIHRATSKSLLILQTPYQPEGGGHPDNEDPGRKSYSISDASNYEYFKFRIGDYHKFSMQYGFGFLFTRNGRRFYPGIPARDNDRLELQVYRKPKIELHPLVHRLLRSEDAKSLEYVMNKIHESFISIPGNVSFYVDRNRGTKDLASHYYLSRLVPLPNPFRGWKVAGYIHVKLSL